MEQPPAPAGQAAAPGSARAPLACEALRAAGFSSTLPVVVVDTGAQRITSWQDVQATMTTCNATGGWGTAAQSQQAAGSMHCQQE